MKYFILFLIIALSGEAVLADEAVVVIETDSIYEPEFEPASPIAPQVYDKYEGEEIAPFTPDDIELKQIRQRIEARRQKLRKLREKKRKILAAKKKKTRRTASLPRKNKKLKKYQKKLSVRKNIKARSKRKRTLPRKLRQKVVNKTKKIGKSKVKRK